MDLNTSTRAATRGPTDLILDFGASTSALPTKMAQNWELQNYSGAGRKYTSASGHKDVDKGLRRP
eukprot:4894240-Heterocapsa_arctica.AAC.1